MPVDTPRHIMARLSGSRVIKGIPMDAPPFECDATVIAGYYITFEALLDAVPAALRINVDETRQQDWGDVHIARAVVLICYESNMIRILIDREIKRVTLLAVITPDGNYLKSQVVVPRDSCKAKLFRIGFTPDRILHASQENGFINAELFNWRMREGLFPSTHSTREKL
jgi:hypothetical protein